MKILILIDKINWAYHSIAKSLVKYNDCKDLKMDILPVKGGVDRIKKVYHKYDFIYVMGFQTCGKLGFLPKDKTGVGIHSCQAWDGGQTMPGKVVMPKKKTVKFLNSFCRVNAVSKYLYDIFKKSGVSNLYYTPNGVDTDIFKPVPKNNKTLVVGFSGVDNELKGVKKIILPSINKTKSEPHFAIRKTSKHVPLEQMHSFYDKMDVYVCASLSEGMSLSVLEAASCGVPIISTRVSGCDEIINHKKNGLFVDRDIDSMSKGIDTMKNNNLRALMSNNIRKDVVEHHGWDKKINKWNIFFKGK